MTRVVPIAINEGVFVAHFSERGLARLEFPDARPPATTTDHTKLPALISKWRQLTRRAIERAASGKPHGPLPPLDLHGSEFQQLVWAALRQIPAGQVRTYGAIASAIGRPRATRAVGNACGANPIPLLIPCHRVVAGHGLGGFSGPPEWKTRLLDREGVTLPLTR